MASNKISGWPSSVTMVNGWPVVDPRVLQVIPGYNVRDAFDPELDEEDRSLLASMLANGYLMDEPITVRRVGNALHVIRGHRRLDAAKRAGIKFVSIAPEAKRADGKERNQQDMLLDLILSNSGKHLAENEKGRVYFALSEGGMSDADIAKHCGIGTVAWVRKSIKLSKANPEMLAIVKAGWTAPTNAILLTGAHGEEVATAVLAEAKASAKRGGRTRISVPKDLAPAEKKLTGTNKVSGKNKGKDTSETEPVTPPVTIVPEVAHVMPVVAGVPQGGPFHLGKGPAKCDLFDASGRSLGAFDNETDAKQLLILINTGWNALAPKASVVPDVEPVKAVPPAVTVPELTKAQEKAAAKARLKAAMDKAAAEKERQAGVAARVAAHEAAEAERHAAALAAEAQAAQTARKPRGKAVVPVAVMVAASAVATGSKGRGNVGQALTQATPARRTARGH